MVLLTIPATRERIAVEKAETGVSFQVKFTNSVKIYTPIRSALISSIFSQRANSGALTNAWRLASQ